MADLPHPDEVLSGKCLLSLDLLRLRCPDSFVCGSLQSNYAVWSEYMTGVPGFEVVRPWLRDGVHIPSFFQPYKGVFNGRVFDSATPPPQFYQNAPVCDEFEGFVSDEILKRLAEGSVMHLGELGAVSPPRVINALSVATTGKMRLILSMRGPNNWCRDTPFSLTPLSEIVRHLSLGEFFSSTDDVQGYKHLRLTRESFQYCGFEWGGHLFCDTTLPFGWKNSAYVYTTVGEVLSAWLRQRGVHTSLWIHDRFVGLAPYL